MTPETIHHVKSSFALVKPIADAAITDFYDRLFRKAPQLRAMFPADMSAQKKKLIMVLATAVGALDRIETLVPTLHSLGAAHVGYGVKDEHYAIVGAALLETLEAGLGEAWTPDVAAAWTETYGALSGAMREGAASVGRDAA